VKDTKKKDYDIPRMNNDTSVFIVRLFHYQKINKYFLKMRMSLVLENGVMVKAAGRKWAKVYSSAAGGR
jgi:hypothetical protein